MNQNFITSSFSISLLFLHIGDSNYSNLLESHLQDIPISIFSTKKVIMFSQIYSSACTNKMLERVSCSLCTYRDDQWIYARSSEDIQVNWSQYFQLITIFGFKLIRGSEWCVGMIFRYWQHVQISIYLKSNHGLTSHEIHFSKNEV